MKTFNSDKRAYNQIEKSGVIFKKRLLTRTGEELKLSFVNIL